MKYSISLSSKFKKEAKKLSQEDKTLAMEIINRLANDDVLEEKYCDHKLQGKLKDFRDCHIKPDLVLIYYKEEKKLVLTALRIGSHSELYNK